MTKLNFAVGLLLLSTAAFAEEANWAQPPLLCIEEVIPGIPSRPCPDMSGMPNPATGDPDIPAEELAYWKSQKFGYGYCRSVEILKREQANPGSMGGVQVSWMRMLAVKDRTTKINATYDAAESYGVPPHILTGAIMQESIFANLGVADDGGNFSCGIAQINLNEWCAWAETQSAEKKTAMGWPTGGVDCRNEATKTFVKPFYDIGLRRLGDLPSYRLEPSHTQNIPIEQVSAGWPDTSSSQKRRRYQITKSFLDNCGKPADAIRAKAFQLKSLYSRFIPEGMKQHETYAQGVKFNKQCMRPLNSRTYPVQTGWLLAVGSYNAGPRAVDAMASTHNWSRAQIADRRTFSRFKPDNRPTPGFTPKDLVSAIYHAGTYNPQTDKVEIPDLDGRMMEWNWFKLCVLQRHIARVVQHVTRPGIPPLVDTLEGSGGCAPSRTQPDGTIRPGFNRR